MMSHTRKDAKYIELGTEAKNEEKFGTKTEERDESLLMSITINAHAIAHINTSASILTPYPGSWI